MTIRQAAEGACSARMTRRTGPQVGPGLNAARERERLAHDSDGLPGVDHPRVPGFTARPEGVEPLTFGFEVPGRTVVSRRTSHLFPNLLSHPYPTVRSAPWVLGSLCLRSEVATLLRISTDSVYGLCARGELPH